MNNKTTHTLSYIHVILFALLCLLPMDTANAQAKRMKLYDDYIDKYQKVAVNKMNSHKIPASITLAQGLLESGGGQSYLATDGNNHFGIKCHNDWKGATIRKNDDLVNECFRKYKKAEESFDDHSTFLQKSRYNSLFALQVTDYKAWARGLQTAGYATDKAYANKLIKLIEDYELYKYDGGLKDINQHSKNIGKESNKAPQNANKGSNNQSKPKVYSHTPYITHGLVYVIARRGDSYGGIAKEFDFKAKDLAKYNEVPQDFPLSEGDLVYFEKKKKKADKPYYEHVVKVGESMHSISQHYGVQVKNIFKINKKDYEYVPTEGDILKLR